MRKLSCGSHVRRGWFTQHRRMRTWLRVLLVAALLAFPVGYVVADLTGGDDEPPARPAIVLSTPAGQAPSLSPSASPSPRPTAGTPSGSPGTPPVRPTDDRDDVIVVTPEPEDVGDDDDDDGSQEDRDDDRDDDGDDGDDDRDDG
jgi:hypothetical protein